MFAIAAGSIAHLNLALGMGVLMPIYTGVVQMIFEFILNKLAPGSRASWTRSTGDTCNIIATSQPVPKLATYISESKGSGGEVVPSYWLTSFAFFIGYTISNAVDSLITPAQAFSDKITHENRSSHAVIVICMTSLFAAAMLYIRFFIMSGCEGHGWWGTGFSLLAASGAASLGYAIYNMTRVSCGSRSVDIFGILSQILPASVTKQNPIVCSSD